MDQQYVCTECGEESDIQGPCPMCGLPMVAAHDDEDSDNDTSFDDSDVNVTSDEEEEDEDEEEARYNPYEE